MRVLLCLLLGLFISPAALACDYYVDQAGQGFVQGTSQYLLCQFQSSVGGMDIYSCSDERASKALVIEKNTGKAVLEGRECKKSGGIPDVCLITNAC